MFGAGRGFGGAAARGQTQTQTQQRQVAPPFGQGGGAVSNPFQSSTVAAPVFGAPSPGFGARAPAPSATATAFGTPAVSAPRQRTSSPGFGAQASPAPSSRSGPAFGTRSATNLAAFGGAASGGGTHTTFGSASRGGIVQPAFGSSSNGLRAAFDDGPHQPHAPAGNNPFASSGGKTGGPAFGGTGTAFSGSRSQPQPAFGGPAGAAKASPGAHTTFGSAAGGNQRRGGRSRPGASPAGPPPFGGDTAGGANPFLSSLPSVSGPLPPDVGGARQSSGLQSPDLQPRTAFGGPRTARAPRDKHADAPFGGPFGGGDLPDGAQQFSSNPFQAGGPSGAAFGGKSNKRTQGKRQPPVNVNQEQNATGPPRRNALGQFTGPQSIQPRPSRSPPPTPPVTANPSSFTLEPTASTVSAAALEKAELASATNLDGRCTDMCSPAERELHIRVDELSVFEKCFPGEPGKERELIIKRFQRSSADHKLDIPEEIRPPGVLRQTQLYIEERIMDLERSGDDPRFNPPRTPELIELYNFCWDRFRMIRKDFVLQNYRGAGGRVHPIVLDVHERIARYHVLSEHELCEVTSFVAQQNMEQLGQTLKSLNELYDESRKQGDPRCLSPFEAECRAYFILCTLDNGRGLDVLKFVKGLPRSIVESPHVKFAMRVFVARHTGDYFSFFSLLKQATYLQACLLFRYVINTRSQALQRMNRGFRTQSYPLADLVELLCFEDLKHAASVCQQHGLKIQRKKDAETGEYLVVRFGGEFDSDSQLRRNKTPLETRASWRFIAVKKGNYLRKDVCRGVSEYEAYPALSNLIQAYEDEERAKLYPSRPRYVDDYSYFVDFATAPPPGLHDPGQAVQPSSAWTSRKAHPHPSALEAEDYDDGSWGMEPEPDEQGQTHELELIAQRKAEILKKQQETMERIRELERAKNERLRLEREKKAAEAECREQAEALAKQQAEKEAEVRREQEELAQRVREAEQLRLLKLKQQQEEEEQQRRAEEASRIKREQEAAELRRQEAMRVKAAEEERRRQEAIRIEEARRREEAERQRQRQIAEDNARRKREAELEARRQAQLARELAEKKRLRRIEKQKLAVLKFRFSLWKTYVRDSRHPAGPAVVRLASAYETSSATRTGPKEKVDWLFARKTGASTPAGLITKKSRSQEASTKRRLGDGDQEVVEAAELPPVDVLGVITPVLVARQPSAPVIPWKLLIADLQSDCGAASFGQWCASRAGVAASLGDSPEIDHVFKSLTTMGATRVSVLACCRYLNCSSLTSERVDPHLLTAVSAVLVPVELTWLLDGQSYNQWDRALEQLITALPVMSRTALVVLAGANSGIRKTSVAPLLEVIEQTTRRIQSSSESRVAAVCFHLMVDEDGDQASRLPASMSRQFEQVLADAAANSPLQPRLAEVGLKEVLEATLHNLRTQETSSTPANPGEQLQARVCDAAVEIYKEVFSSDGMQRDFPPPELERILPEPPVGWNSLENQTIASTALRALASVRVDFAALDTQAKTLPPGQVCDSLFKAAVDLVDRLFQSNGSADAEVSLFELKKRLFAALVPIHERVTSAEAAATIEVASRLAPWRDMLDMVYGTYIEALRDVSIFTPVDSPLRRRVLAATKSTTTSPTIQTRPPPGRGKRAKTSSAPPPVVVSIKHLKTALDGRVPSIAVSLPASSKPATPTRLRSTTRALQRLRTDLDREKAAASRFQRMLRLEVARWSADGAIP